MFNYLSSAFWKMELEVDRATLLGVALDKIILENDKNSKPMPKPAADVAINFVKAFRDGDSKLGKRMKGVIQMVLKEFKFDRRYTADDVYEAISDAFSVLSMDDMKKHLEEMMKECGGFENYSKAVNKMLMMRMKMDQRKKRDAHPDSGSDSDSKCEVSNDASMWIGLYERLDKDVQMKVAEVVEFMVHMEEGKLNGDYMGLAMNITSFLTEMLNVTDSDDMKDEDSMGARFFKGVMDKDSEMGEKMKDVVEKMLKAFDLGDYTAEGVIEEYSKMFSGYELDDMVKYMDDKVEECGGFEEYGKAYFKKTMEMMGGMRRKRGAHGDDHDDKCDLSMEIDQLRPMLGNMKDEVKGKVSNALKAVYDMMNEGKVANEHMEFAMAMNELYEMVKGSDVKKSALKAIAEKMVDSISDDDSDIRKSTEEVLNMVLMTFNITGVDADSLLKDYAAITIGDTSREDAVKYNEALLEACGGYDGYMQAFNGEVAKVFAGGRTKRDNHPTDTDDSGTSDPGNGTGDAGTDLDKCDMSDIGAMWRTIAQRMSSEHRGKVARIFMMLQEIEQGKVDPMYMPLAMRLEAYHNELLNDMDDYKKADSATIASRIFMAVGYETSKERMVLVDIVKKFLDAFDLKAADPVATLDRFRDTWDGMDAADIVSYLSGLLDGCGGVEGAFVAILTEAREALNPVTSLPATRKSSSCDVTLFVSKVAQAVGGNIDVVTRVKGMAALLNVTDMLEGKDSGKSMLAEDFRAFLNDLTQKADDDVTDKDKDGEYTKEDMLKYVVSKMIVAVKDETSIYRDFWSRIVWGMLYDFGIETTGEQIYATMTAIRDSVSDIDAMDLGKYIVDMIGECGGLGEAMEGILADLNKPTDKKRKRRDAHCDFSELVSRVRGVVDKLDGKTKMMVFGVLRNFTEMLKKEGRGEMGMNMTMGSGKNKTMDMRMTMMKGRSVRVFIDIFKNSGYGVELLAGITKVLEEAPLPVVSESLSHLVTVLTIPEWYDLRFMAMSNFIMSAMFEMDSEHELSLAQHLYINLNFLMKENDLKLYLSYMKVVNDTMDPSYAGLLALVKVLEMDDGDLFRKVGHMCMENPEAGMHMAKVLEWTVMKDGTVRGKMLKQVLMLLFRLPGDNSETVRQMVHHILSDDMMGAKDHDHEEEKDEGSDGTCRRREEKEDREGSCSDMAKCDDKKKPEEGMLHSLVKTLVGSNDYILKEVIREVMGGKKDVDYEDMAERIREQMKE